MTLHDMSREQQMICQQMEDLAYDAVLGDSFKDAPAALALVALLGATGRLLAELGASANVPRDKLLQHAAEYGKLITLRVKLEYDDEVPSVPSLETMKPEGHG